MPKGLGVGALLKAVNHNFPKHSALRACLLSATRAAATLGDTAQATS